MEEEVAPAVVPAMSTAVSNIKKGIVYVGCNETNGSSKLRRPCLQHELCGGVGDAVPHAAHVSGERLNAAAAAEADTHRQRPAHQLPVRLALVRGRGCGAKQDQPCTVRHLLLVRERNASHVPNSDAPVFIQAAPAVREAETHLEERGG